MGGDGEIVDFSETLKEVDDSQRSSLGNSVEQENILEGDHHSSCTVDLDMKGEGNLPFRGILFIPYMWQCQASVA